MSRAPLAVLVVVAAAGSVAVVTMPAGPSDVRGASAPTPVGTETPTTTRPLHAGCVRYGRHTSVAAWSHHGGATPAGPLAQPVEC